VAVSGTIVGSGLGLTGTETGTGTATLSGTTLTVTEPATTSTTNLGGTQVVGQTDVFTGTYSAGTFTATSGTFTRTSCSGANCSSVTLNQSTPFDMGVSGTVSASGGTITAIASSLGGAIITTTPYTFAAGSAGGGGSSTTSPTFISTNAVQVLGQASNINVNGNGAYTAASPGTLVYAAADSSNKVHVYGVNLANPSNSTTAPTATQLGSLSLSIGAGAAISTVVCSDSSSLSASTNALDPTTLFVVLHIAGSTGCNTTGDIWEVVHYGDSVTTAPVAVTALTTSTATPTSFEALYQPGGHLAGIVALDPGSSKLQLFADDTFTSPTTLVSSVTSASSLYSRGSVALGTNLFLSVTVTGGQQAVYRIPYSFSGTTATAVYTAQGTLSSTGVADDNNVYFTDTTTGSGTLTPGAVTVAGNVSSQSVTSLMGTITGQGTATLSGNTLTVTEPATDDQTNLGGDATVAFTDVFTGTVSAGTFTAVSGTQTATHCTQVVTPPPNTSCQSTPLHSPTTFDTVSGSISSAGGAIDITSSGAGGIAQIAETYTFAAAGGGGGSTALVQIPLAGGTATQLYSSGTAFNLLGANDAVVVFYTGTTTASLFTVPVGATTTSATALGASSYAGSISAGTFMQPTTAGSYASNLVYLTVTAASPISYSSEILNPNGTVVQALTADSAFLAFGEFPFSGSVLQIQNIGTSGGYGGGSIFNVKAANLTGVAGGTALSATTGGAAYVVPANTLAVLLGVSNTIGIGALEPLGGGTSVGLAYDLSQDLIESITLTNTSIGPL
jgi:hypothetical protein